MPAAPQTWDNSLSWDSPSATWDAAVPAPVRAKKKPFRRCHHAQRGAEPPSESSFKRVLEKAELTKPRKRRLARQSGRLALGLKAQSPSEVWSGDFKGWWHDNSGQRIEPLTVRACFERLFESLGPPAANSSPEPSL